MFGFAFSVYDVNFNVITNIYNIFTKKVIPKELAIQFLKLREMEKKNI